MEGDWDKWLGNKRRKVHINKACTVQYTGLGGVSGLRPHTCTTRIIFAKENNQGERRGVLETVE